MTDTTNPGLLQRALRRIAKVEAREVNAVIAAFFLLFCVLGGYFSVRPVRETVGTVLGEEETADLWKWTAIFAIAIVPIYGWLVSKLRRSVLLPCIYGFTALVLAFYALDLRSEEQIRLMGPSFYVFISVVNLLLVSIFWTFLLDVFSSEQTRRLFGFIAAGGTIGALIGPFVTRLMVKQIGTSGVLLIGAGGFLLAIFFQWLLIAAIGRPQTHTGERADDRAVGGNPFAGIGLVLKSPYLLKIALFVVLLSAINTILYFEQLRQVTELTKSLERRTEVFANFDFIVQGLTTLTQILLTGWIARNFGVKLLLTLVPAVLMVGFVALGSLGSFWALAVAMVIRRWGEYAFVRPGREMLMSRVSREAKYKAKNLIDVPVYRTSDYMFAQLRDALAKSALGSSGTAFVGAGLAALWMFTGWVLGREYDRDRDRQSN